MKAYLRLSELAAGFNYYALGLPEWGDPEGFTKFFSNTLMGEGKQTDRSAALDRALKEQRATREDRERMRKEADDRREEEAAAYQSRQEDAFHSGYKAQEKLAEQEMRESKIKAPSNMTFTSALVRVGNLAGAVPRDMGVDTLHEQLEVQRRILIKLQNLGYPSTEFTDE